MKIDGTNPLTLNKISEQVRQSEVHRLGETTTDNKVTNKQRTHENRQLSSSGNFHTDELELALSQANETVDALNIGIRFRLHEQSDRFMVQIVNKLDDEVIKEIPSEQLLNLVGQIQEMIGVLVDERR